MVGWDVRVVLTRTVMPACGGNGGIVNSRGPPVDSRTWYLDA